MKKFLILAILSLVSTVHVCAQNVLSSSYNTSTNLTNKDDFTPYWEFSSEPVGFGFLKGGEYIFEASMGANRYITERTTIGARLGYSTIDIRDSEQGGSTETKLRFITIPVELGYILVNTESGFKIKAFAGVGINYCLKSKFSGYYWYGGNKHEYDYDLDLDGKIGLDGRVGIKLCYNDWVVFASYQVPLNSKQENFTGEDAYPKVGLGIGF